MPTESDKIAALVTALRATSDNPTSSETRRDRMILAAILSVTPSESDRYRIAAAARLASSVAPTVSETILEKLTPASSVDGSVTPTVSEINRANAKERW